MLYLVSGNVFDQAQEVELDHQGWVRQYYCHIVFMLGGCVTGIYVHGI